VIAIHSSMQQMKQVKNKQNKTTIITTKTQDYFSKEKVESG
jgi:hypothetical protein